MALTAPPLAQDHLWPTTDQAGLGQAGSAGRDITTPEAIPTQPGAVHLQATAYALQGTTPLILSRDTATEHRQAAHWVQERIAHIAEQLDHPYSLPLWELLREGQLGAPLLAALADGHPCTVELTTDDAHYVLAVIPHPAARPGASA